MADADTQITIYELHDAIIAKIAAQFPDLQTVEAYRQDRKSIDLPACLIELTELDADNEQDPGTGQLSVLARFEVRLVIGFRQGLLNPKLEIRKLAAAMAAFVHRQRWGVPVGAAEVIGAYPDYFDPEFNQFEVWRVEWQQSVHLGESVWDNDGTIPTTVFLGFAPEIGPDYEDAYVEVASPPEEEP